MREVQMIWDVMNEKCPIRWLLKLLNKPEVQIFSYLIFKEQMFPYVWPLVLIRVASVCFCFEMSP